MAGDSRNSKHKHTSTSANSLERMVLRVKSREKMKRLAVMSSREDNEDERRGRRISSTKKKKKKPIAKKTDPKMPKKPPTAFFYFLEDFRKEYQEQNPDVRTMRDIGKACGEKWKTMTYEEKVQYYDIATEKRREFDQAMAEYVKRRESCGEVETGDESDYDE